MRASSDDLEKTFPMALGALMRKGLPVFPEDSQLPEQPRYLSSPPCRNCQIIDFDFIFRTRAADPQVTSDGDSIGVFGKLLHRWSSHISSIVGLDPLISSSIVETLYPPISRTREIDSPSLSDGTSVGVFRLPDHRLPISDYLKRIRAIESPYSPDGISISVIGELPDYRLSSSEYLKRKGVNVLPFSSDGKSVGVSRKLPDIWS